MFKVSCLMLQPCYLNGCDVSKKWDIPPKEPLLLGKPSFTDLRTMSTILNHPLVKLDKIGGWWILIALRTFPQSDTPSRNNRRTFLPTIPNHSQWFFHVFHKGFINNIPSTHRNSMALCQVGRSSRWFRGFQMRTKTPPSCEVRRKYRWESSKL